MRGMEANTTTATTYQPAIGESVVITLTDGTDVEGMVADGDLDSLTIRRNGKTRKVTHASILAWNFNWIAVAK